MSTVKLIVVPGRGVDLFSLKKSFGIKKGPVKTPIALPIEVVAELVNQYNRPEIFEVVLESVQKYPTELKIYSTPVLLTPDNYKLSYFEIAGVEPIEVTVEDAPVVEVKEEEETFQESIIVDTTDEELQKESTTEEEVIVDADAEVIESTEEVTPDVVEDVTDADAEVIETADEEEILDEAKDPMLVATASKNKNSHKNSNKRG